MQFHIDVNIQYLSKRPCFSTVFFRTYLQSATLSASDKGVISIDGMLMTPAFCQNLVNQFASISASNRSGKRRINGNRTFKSVMRKSGNRLSARISL